MAFSGGLDSTVLLHWLAAQREALPGVLQAQHVDHGLQPHSARWAEHCAAFAASLGVPFQAHRARVVVPPGASPEAAAREARYQLLADALEPDDVFLTAHHQDDQVETLLLQLFRGAGPTGLGAMRQRVPLGAGWLLRPLLHLPREALLRYARHHELPWVEDPSNADTRIPRNWLRHQMLPELRARWPGLDSAVARSAKLCATAAQQLDSQAQADLQGVLTSQGCISLAALLMLPVVRQQYCLRHWLRQRALPLPSQQQLEQLLVIMQRAATDRQPCIRWPGVEVRRFRGALYAMTPLPEVPTGTWSLSLPGELVLPGVGCLQLHPGRGQGLAARLIPGAVQVGFRQGGERFRPVGSPHQRSLKQWCQAQGLAPWERDRLPLLQHNGQLLAVGEWIDDAFQAQAGEQSWVIAWQKAALFVNV